MDSHFPNWETGHLYGLFDLRASLTWAERKEMLVALCRRYGKSFDVVNRALFSHNTDSPGKGSVFVRAQYHFTEAKRLALQKTHQEPRFPSKPKINEDGHGAMVLVAKCRLRDPASRNTYAWLQTLRDMRKLVSKPSYLPLIELLECLISRLSSTATIERWFKQIALTEIKQRANKLSLPVLEAALKFRVQDLGGVHAEAEFDPRKILLRTVPAKTAGGESITWPATEYAVSCQKM